jgi:menaquinone-specific isochorismate synthase
LNLIKAKISSFLKSIDNLVDSRLVRFTIKIDSFDIGKILSSKKLDSQPYFYWSNPENEETYLAVGEKKIVDIEDFETKHGHWNSERIQFLNNPDEPNASRFPVLFNARKFCADKKDNLWSDFKSTKWFIPQLLFIQDKNCFYLSFFFDRDEEFESIVDFAICLIEEIDAIPSSYTSGREQISPDDTKAWESIVNNALEQISQGTIKKIVLARRIEFRVDDQFNIVQAIRFLEIKYANCIIYVFKQSDSIFFGATPEKLFSLHDRLLMTDALAGSIGRGNSEQEDLILESTLLNSTKNLSEHNDVFNFLIHKLESLTSELIFEKTPKIKKLKNIQHLWTPIVGKLIPGITIMDLISQLHPTPAVCGLPSQKAMGLINQYENFDRGLYSGVLGWLNEKQCGEFIVGLRSALLCGNKLFAFAGSGIVSGSDPISELIETELKLKPILSFFSHETINQSK